MITCTVHKFKLGDVEDPEIYAAQPIYEFQQTEKGKWVMDNAIEEPHWCSFFEPHVYGYQYAIRAKFTEKDYTYFKLKFE